MHFKSRSLFLIVAILWIGLANAQDISKRDSLTRLLESAEHDTIRTELYIQLSKSISNQDSIQKLKYADSAINLTTKSNYIKHKAFALKNKAEIFQSLNRHEEAFDDFKTALQLFDSIGNRVETANIYEGLGNVFYKLNDFEESINHHKKALESRVSMKDTLAILESEKAVAVMLWRKGYLTEAENHYKQALTLSEYLGDTNSVGSVLNSLGAIYWGYGNYNSALEYFEKALNISLKIENKKKYVLIVNNIGLIYHEWGNNDKAMENYQEGLRVAKDENYAYGLAYSYNNMGEIYQLNKEFEKALLSFDSALVNYKKLSKQIGMAFSYRHIGDAYLGMKNYYESINYYKLSVKTAGDINSKHHQAWALTSLAQAYFENKSFQLAKTTIEKSLQISLKQNYKDLSKDNYFLLSKLAEQTGSYTSALSYYKKATALKDVIFNENSSKQMVEMQTRYETEKKERENNILRKEEQYKDMQLKANEIQIQNQYILLFSFAVLLLVATIFASLLYKNRRKLLKSQAQLTKQNEEISVQKEELSVQGENLKQTNGLLRKKTDALENKKEELQNTIVELKKATDFKNKIFTLIGHDLRGPVGTIGSIISLAMDERIEEKKRHKMLAASKDSAVATYNLLENLLVWANNEQGEINYQPQLLSFFKLVDNNINLLSETAEKKKIKLLVEIPSEIEVFADHNTLDTIIRNLISNSIKYTYEYGEISVFAKKNDDFVNIEVSDNGIGMSENELKKITNSGIYFSVPGTRGEKGSGLGLQLCFEFIKMNGGSYKILSEKGKGTQFKFTLPSKA